MSGWGVKSNFTVSTYTTLGRTSLHEVLCKSSNSMILSNPIYRGREYPWLRSFTFVYFNKAMTPGFRSVSSLTSCFPSLLPTVPNFVKSGSGSHSFQVLQVIPQPYLSCQRAASFY